MGICLGILQKNLAVIWMFPRVHVGSIIAIWQVELLWVLIIPRTNLILFRTFQQSVT
jgi:hypothetical protein